MCDYTDVCESSTNECAKAKKDWYPECYKPAKASTQPKRVLIIHSNIYNMRLTNISKIRPELDILVISKQIEQIASKTLYSADFWCYICEKRVLEGKLLPWEEECEIEEIYQLERLNRR